MAGAGPMVKTCEALFPPPPPGGVAPRVGGFWTETLAEPAVVKRLAGTVTLRAIDVGAGEASVANVVKTPPAFQTTDEACVGSIFGMKFVPVNASVSADEPAAALVGLIEVNVGMGFAARILKAREVLDNPLPLETHCVAENGGLIIVTAAAPAVLRSDSGTLTTISVADGVGDASAVNTTGAGGGVGGVVVGVGGCQQTMAPGVMPLATTKSDPLNFSVTPPAGTWPTVTLVGLRDCSNGVGFGGVVGVTKKLSGLESPLLPAPEKGLWV